MACGFGSDLDTNPVDAMFLAKTGNLRAPLDIFGLSAFHSFPLAETQDIAPLQVKVTDPETYSALVYSPPSERNSLPLLVVLPGAGRNDKAFGYLMDSRYPELASTRNQQEKK